MEYGDTDILRNSDKFGKCHFTITDHRMRK